jgi:Predicted membrane protein (DUF2254)
MVVYFADHLAHSIQIDAINRRVERNARRAIAHEDTENVSDVALHVPEWAVPLRGRESGYIQTVYPVLLLPLVSDQSRRWPTPSAQYRVSLVWIEFEQRSVPSAARSTHDAVRRSREPNPDDRVDVRETRPVSTSPLRGTKEVLPERRRT